MKLTSIQISNVIGIGRADLDMSKAVMVISAENASGKSSIADSISMAFIGKPCRVNAKKDLGQLLHNGAEKGRVSIKFGDEDEGAEFRLPKGEHHVSEFAGADFMSFVLDPQMFGRISDDERRTFLFRLTNCKASAKVVGEKLEARGVSQDLIEEILPLMRGGFPAAAKEAYARATQAKGAWRQVTGENWGSEKAVGWKPVTPDQACPKPEALKLVMDAHQKTQTDIDAGRSFITAQSALLGASTSYKQRLKEAQDTAELLERRQTKLAVTEKDLAAWRIKLPLLEGKLAELRAGVEPLTCPCCDAQLRIVEGELQQFAGLKADTQASSSAALEVTKAKKAIDDLQKVLSNDQRDVAQSEAAAKQVKAIESEKIDVVDEAKLKRAKDALEALVEKEKTQRAEFNSMQALRNTYADLGKKEEEAAAAHANVTDWLKAGDALAPDGIPGELLNDALAPVNDSIGVLSGMCGWSKAVVQPDMSITYGGRLYGLCSESEKWRADALIALAVAQISGLRMVLLDRFDVLDSPSRQRLLGMLLKLDQLGAMDTMIIAGTMKQPMPPHASYSSVWIRGGIAETVTA